MTRSASRRPYKTHMSKEEAIHEIQKKVGSQFDPAVVAALVKVHQKPAFDVVINDYPDDSVTRNTAEMP